MSLYEDLLSDFQKKGISTPTRPLETDMRLSSLVSNRKNTAANFDMLFEKEQSRQRQLEERRAAARNQQQASEQQPQAPSGLRGIVSGVGSALASPFQRYGRFVGNQLATNTRDVVAARETTARRGSEIAESVARAGQKLRDPSVTEEEKKRWRKYLKDITAQGEEEARGFNVEAEKLIDDTNFRKAIAAGVEVASYPAAGLLAKAAGIGRATRLRTMTRPQIIRAASVGAAEGGAIGASAALQGDDTSISNIARSTATGAIIGGGLPVAGVGIGRGAEKLKTVKANRVARVGKESSEDLIDQVIKEAAEYESRYKRTPIQKAAQGIRETLNSTASLRKIDKAMEKILGRKLKASEKTEAAFDEFLNYKNQVQGAKTEKMSTGLSYQDILGRHAKDRERFVSYLNARADRYSRTKKVTLQKKLSDTDLEEIITKYEKNNPEAKKEFKTLNELVNKARDKARKDGYIDSELDKALGRSTEYLPVTTAKAEIPKAKVGGRSATTSRQGLIKEATGADVPLSVNFQAIENYLNSAYKGSTQSRLSQKLKKAVEEGLVSGGKVVSEPAAKANKKMLRDYAKAVTKEANKLSRSLSFTKKEARTLAKEINDFNKQGLRVSLKKGGKKPLPDFNVKGFGGDIPTSQTGKLTETRFVSTAKGVQKEPSKEISRLSRMRDKLIKRAEELAPSRKPEPVTKAPVGGGGLLSIAADPQKATKLRKQAADLQKKIKNIQKQPAKAVDAKTAPSKIGQTDTERFLKSLIEADVADVTRLQKKIATREPKLAAKLQEIIDKQTELSALKSEARGARQATFEILDDDTTNMSIISGLDEQGLPYKMEMPPEITKLIKGLDEQSQNFFMQSALNVQKTFQLFWTGFANPVFNTVLMPIYETATNLNALISNPSAFARSLTPDSFAQMFKSMRQSDGFRRGIVGKGAAMQGGSGMAQDYAKTIESAMSQRSFKSRTGYLVKNPKEAMQVLDQFTGIAGNMSRTRVAKGFYKDALKKGMTEAEALSEAAWAFNNMAPNFNRTSAFVRNANAFVPFATASVAGNRSLWQPILENPARAAAVYGGITAMLVGATAHNLSSEVGQEFYKQMRESGKDFVLEGNIIIVLPTATFNQDTGEWSGIIKIPIPPELRKLNGLAYSSTEEFVSGESNLDPTYVSSAVFNTMTGGVAESAAGGPAIARTGQILAGSKGSGSLINPEPLVRGSMAERPKEDQVYDWTSDPAKFFSQVSGRRISPIQADAIIGQFGSFGQVTRGRGLGDQITGRFTGARTDSLVSQINEQYYPAASGLSEKIRNANANVSQAREIAKEHNKMVEGLLQQIRNSNLPKERKEELQKKIRPASLETYALEQRINK